MGLQESQTDLRIVLPALPQSVVRNGSFLIIRHSVTLSLRLTAWHRIINRQETRKDARKDALQLITVSVAALRDL